MRPPPSSPIVAPAAVPVTKQTSFRRNDLQPTFMEDSTDLKEVNHFTLDAERKDRILRDNRAQATPISNAPCVPKV